MELFKERMAVRPNRSPRRRIAAALHTQRGPMFVQSVGIIVGLAISTVGLTMSLMIAPSTLHGQLERTSAYLMLKFEHDLCAGSKNVTSLFSAFGGIMRKEFVMG